MRFRKVLVFVASLFAVASNAATPDFPHPAAHFIGNPHNYESTAVQQQLAKFQLSIIGYWPGWDSGRGTSMNQVATNIKAINPNTKVFLYVIPTQAGSSLLDLTSKLDSMRWWLYPSGTSGSPIADNWPGTHTTNMTQFTPNDSNGDNYTDWFARWSTGIYLTANPKVDGFYVDGVYQSPRDTGDWNRDGIIDNSDNPTVRQWYRQGFVRYFAKLNQLSPGKIHLGNIADWGSANDGTPEYRGMTNGGLMEGMIGFNWSVDSWGSFTQMMAWYRNAMSLAANPKLVVFHQVGSLTDYRAMRYGLGASLMDDGYYAYNLLSGQDAGYGEAPWFDEFGAKLGQALAGPSLTAWKNGVFRRDFENGIALVNPKGNGAVTIALDGQFKRMTGTQDPSTNNGQTVTSVTLQDRDGLILMRTTVQPKPVPPANVTVR